MERYTHRTGNGLEYSVSKEDQEKAINELGRYENIGIEPGELEWMMTDYKAMKDAEEQGRLIEFPVTIGDTLYYVPDWMHDKRIDEVKVKDYRLLGGNCRLIEVAETEPKQYLISGYQNISRIGKDLFRTMDEAQAKLKELEGNNAENH